MDAGLAGGSYLALSTYSKSKLCIHSLTAEHPKKRNKLEQYHNPVHIILYYTVPTPACIVEQTNKQAPSDPPPAPRSPAQSSLSALADSSPSARGYQPSCYAAIRGPGPAGRGRWLCWLLRGGCCLSQSALVSKACIYIYIYTWVRDSRSTRSHLSGRLSNCRWRESVVDCRWICTSRSAGGVSLNHSTRALAHVHYPENIITWVRVIHTAQHPRPPEYVGS